MSERFLRRPEVLLAASTLACSTLGYLAIEDWQGNQQQERLRRAQDLMAERDVWYSGEDGLEQSAKNRDMFMASLPEGCEGALAPFYFDSDAGKNVEPNDVVASIQDTCDIGPYDVVVARETMNNIARLFTIIRGLDEEIEFNKSYRMKFSEKYGERAVGGAFGAAAGFFLPFVGIAIYDSVRKLVSDHRRTRFGTRKS